MSLVKKVGLLVLISVGILVITFFYFRSLPKPDYSDRGVAKVCDPAPQFTDYAVSVNSNPVHSVDFGSNSRAEAMKTEINAATESGKPNFAETYIIAEQDCGKFCQNHAIIEIDSGIIVAHGIHSTLGLDFRPDSKLLVVNPPDYPLPQGTPRNVPRYYEMHNEGLYFLCEGKN